MYLGDEVGVLERYDLLEVGLVRDVLAVARAILHRAARVVLEAADDVHDELVAEEYVEQRRLVQVEQAAHDLVQLMQRLGVLQVLAHGEQLEQLLDVGVRLEQRRQLLLVRLGLARHLAHEEVAYLLELGQLARRQVARRRRVHVRRLELVVVALVQCVHAAAAATATATATPTAVTARKHRRTAAATATRRRGARGAARRRHDGGRVLAEHLAYLLPYLVAAGLLLKAERQIALVRLGPHDERVLLTLVDNREQDDRVEQYGAVLLRLDHERDVTLLLVVDPRDVAGAAVDPLARLVQHVVLDASLRVHICLPLLLACFVSLLRCCSCLIN